MFDDSADNWEILINMERADVLKLSELSLHSVQNTFSSKCSILLYVKFCVFVCFSLQALLCLL